MSPAGFPHSDTLGSQLGCQLLEAYRRLLRPSSAPGAKAFTVCPYKLATQHNKPDQHPPHPERHNGCRPQNTKMLASTMQFSSNEQTPTPHPPPDTIPNRRQRQFDRRPAPQDNTHPTPTGRGACSLRTQQRATTHHPNPEPRFPARRIQLYSHDPDPGTNRPHVDDPPMSNHPTHERCERGHLDPDPPPDGDTT